MQAMYCSAPEGHDSRIALRTESASAKLRVVIAEDEPLGRERLRKLLRRISDVEIIGECGDGVETIECIRRQRPDLVFLDVKMPKLDGFDVLRALTNPLPAIIFVTAYDEYAVRAFEAHATDYLLKPFDQPRLEKALQRARNQLRPDQNRQIGMLRELLDGLANRTPELRRLTVRSSNGVSLVNVSEIDWIRGADNYAELHVGKKVHLLRQTLTALEGQLPKTKFMRISRSLLVNVERIVELSPKTHGDYTLLLRDGTRLTGTRKYRQDLLRLRIT